MGGRENHSSPLKMHVDVMVQFMNPPLRIFDLNILIFITFIVLFIGFGCVNVC